MEAFLIIVPRGNLKKDTKLYITFEEEKQRTGSLPMTVRSQGIPLCNLQVRVTQGEHGTIIVTLEQSENE